MAGIPITSADKIIADNIDIIKNPDNYVKETIKVYSFTDLYTTIFQPNDIIVCNGFLTTPSNLYCNYIDKEIYVSYYSYDTAKIPDRYISKIEELHKEQISYLYCKHKSLEEVVVNIELKKYFLFKGLNQVNRYIYILSSFNTGIGYLKCVLSEDCLYNDCPQNTLDARELFNKYMYFIHTGNAQFPKCYTIDSSYLSPIEKKIYSSLKRKGINMLGEYSNEFMYSDICKISTVDIDKRFPKEVLETKIPYFIRRLDFEFLIYCISMFNLDVDGWTKGSLSDLKEDNKKYFCKYTGDNGFSLVFKKYWLKK